MYISEINIENFKGFKGRFNLKLNRGLNILVGDNEAGKSSILEAIHLALSGLFNGRYFKNELTEYLFNNEVVAEYIKDLEAKKSASLPYVLIELFVEGHDLAQFQGDGNNDRKQACGISFKIAFDEKYQQEYEELIKSEKIKTIPIEYYEIFWTSFARGSITARSIPIKSALIDASSNRNQNGSDMYISRIIKDFLEPEERVRISQAHRKMRDTFMEDKSINTINDKIKLASNISNKNVKLSADLSSKNAWENSLMTYLNNVPFHYVGKGEQCIVKTKLALSHKKSKEANVLLLEEPESHLSHTKLNQLIREIKDGEKEKQIIVSTHSSFVANKLGLGNLILLNNKETIRFSDLNSDTKLFFEKLSGYDTLRLILCQKAILVEGDSDELILQKAYRNNNDGKLPIENGVEVISVGTSFLRFLEIAKKIRKPVAVVTDNDGDLEAMEKKYADYRGENATNFIQIHFDGCLDSGTIKGFNYNTLEPKLLKENSLELFNNVFGTNYPKVEDLHRYMKRNKTACALKIFDSNKKIKFPVYILDAIK